MDKCNELSELTILSELVERSAFVELLGPM